MKKKNKLQASEDTTIIDESSPFFIAEAYKTLRTNLLFSLAGAPGNSKVIIITSSVPHEGKSTTCANVAVSMAMKGEKVIIIDADMRKPVQNRKFRVNNGRGLSTVLVNQDELSVAIHYNVRPSLDLLTAGQLAPNPMELLSSPAMGRLLEELSGMYDYIFIDTPPVNVVSDALVVGQYARGALLVVRPDICTHETLTHTIDALKLAKVNTLGIVMSNVKTEGAKYGYKSHYYKYRYEKYDNREQR